jgi:hypothetical protein
MKRDLPAAGISPAPADNTENLEFKEAGKWSGLIAQTNGLQAQNIKLRGAKKRFWVPLIQIQYTTTNKVNVIQVNT